VLSVEIYNMEGGSAPDHLSECAVCGGDLRDVELDDLIGW